MPRVNQINLLAAIWEHLSKKQGIKHGNSRQMNACIDAANLVVDAFAKENQPAKPKMGLAAWLASDDTGLSSMCMARTLAPLAGLDGVPGAGVGYGAQHPIDPDDFGRCFRLLEAVPALRKHLSHMATVSTAWARLTDVWAAREALYREEAPKKTAPKLYARMKQLGV